MTRPPVRLGAVALTDDGNLLLTTPPHPQTGATTREIDPLDWVHAFCTQIPDIGQHLARYYGAHANRARACYSMPGEPADTVPTGGPTHGTSVPEGDDDATTMNRRRSWARLLRKFMEVDPLLCPSCHVPMKIVAPVLDPRLIDAILKHVRGPRGRDPFQPRAPPAA